MRVSLIGNDLDGLRKLLSRFDLEEVSQDPEVVISHGGDGTLVGAERLLPGVPKVPIRNSEVCRKCKRHETRTILKRLSAGELVESRHAKVEGEIAGRRKLAMNEVGLHMDNPASAVRFLLSVNGQAYVDDEIIGDGLVVATPFGSTAYFRSITRGTFRHGLGLAIMNSVNPVEWAVLDPRDTIEVEITRGPAVILSDNDPEKWPLQTGDVAEFRLSSKAALVLGLDALRCPDCLLIRAE
ncbi:MAG: hypothetical protein GY725_05495 [bacterium]|nr:hypothetical protein [bacterium]